MYVSEKFATPQEFEAWLNENEHPNKTVLDNVTGEKLTEWDKKACKIAIVNGKIQLKCKDDNVLAEAPLSNAVDGSTIGCSGDCLIVTGVKNQNGGVVKLWLGTTAAYNDITVKDTNNTIYVKTDDNTIATINAELNSLSNRATALEGRATDLESRCTALEKDKSNTGHKHSKSEITDFPTSMTPTAHTHEKSEITDFPTSMPASDVSDWAKASTKPTYTASEVGTYSASDIDAKFTTQGEKISTLETWKTNVSDGTTSVSSADKIKLKAKSNSSVIKGTISGTGNSTTISGISYPKQGVYLVTATIGGIACCTLIQSVTENIHAITWEFADNVKCTQYGGNITFTGMKDNAQVTDFQVRLVMAL